MLAVLIGLNSTIYVSDIYLSLCNQVTNLAYNSHVYATDCFLSLRNNLTQIAGVVYKHIQYFR